MPFFKEININENTIAYFWKISEDIDWLFQNVQLNKNSLARLETMSSIEHKKGFLAVRMLLQHKGLSDFNLFYDEFGKPHLKVESKNSKVERTEPNTLLSIPNSKVNFSPLKVAALSAISKSPNLQVVNTQNISISHSHEFSCICISNQSIGIDLEKRKDKILKIAPRFMDILHLKNLSETDKIAKATVIWGIKESIFKRKNEKGISFPNHISESPFQLKDNKGKAHLNFNNISEDFEFEFEFVDDYVFVCVL